MPQNNQCTFGNIAHVAQVEHFH